MIKRSVMAMPSRRDRRSADTPPLLPLLPLPPSPSSSSSSKSPIVGLPCTLDALRLGEEEEVGEMEVEEAGGPGVRRSGAAGSPDAPFGL